MQGSFGNLTTWNTGTEKKSILMRASYKQCVISTYTFLKVFHFHVWMIWDISFQIILKPSCLSQLKFSLQMMLLAEAKQFLPHCPILSSNFRPLFRNSEILGGANFSAYPCLRLFADTVKSYKQDWWTHTEVYLSHLLSRLWKVK